jgi:hypothetical protein
VLGREEPHIDFLLLLRDADADHLGDHHIRRMEIGLPGWACKIRTGESVRELSDWNCVATSSEGRN